MSSQQPPYWVFCGWFNCGMFVDKWHSATFPIYKVRIFYQIGNKIIRTASLDICWQRTVQSFPSFPNLKSKFGQIKYVCPITIKLNETQKYTCFDSSQVKRLHRAIKIVIFIGKKCVELWHKYQKLKSPLNQLFSPV